MFPALLLGIAISEGDKGPEKDNTKPDYSHLITKDGREYFECFVRKSDQEGLLITHRKGMAKISFFDLSPEIRDKYDFDPIAAMRMHRELREADRLLRKQRVLEAEKIRADQALEKALAEMQVLAESEWIPVEARILSTEGDFAFARVKKVVFHPTTRISPLGFENPGPPKRVTQLLGEGAYFLRSLGPKFKRGSTWKGYMEPFASGERAHPGKPGNSVPVHLAVPPP